MMVRWSQVTVRWRSYTDFHFWIQYEINQILLRVSDEINCQVLIYVLSAARTFIKPELGVKSYQQHDVQENKEDKQTLNSCKITKIQLKLIQMGSLISKVGNPIFWSPHFGHPFYLDQMDSLDGWQGSIERTLLQ